VRQMRQARAEAQAKQAQMQQAGMMAELRIGEGLWHVFEFYDIPEAHRSLQRIADFLRQSIEKA